MEAVDLRLEIDVISVFVMEAADSGLKIDVWRIVVLVDGLVAVVVDIN